MRINPVYEGFFLYAFLFVFDLGNVCVVLVSAAHIVDLRRDILETLIPILGIPLRGWPIVRARLLDSGTTASPLRQTLLRGKSHKGSDRAGFTAMTMHIVTLIGRILERMFLAGGSVGLRQRALLNGHNVIVARAIQTDLP